MYRDGAVTIRSALLTSRARYKSAFIRRFTIERSGPLLSWAARFSWSSVRVQKKKKKEKKTEIKIHVYNKRDRYRKERKREENILRASLFARALDTPENVFHSRFYKM